VRYLGLRKVSRIEDALKTVETGHIGIFLSREGLGMVEAIALGVLGGVFLGLLAVTAICAKKLWTWVAQRMPADIDGVARATGRATARAKRRTSGIVQAFKDGRAD
jgi:hypothetical protein